METLPAFALVSFATLVAIVDPVGVVLPFLAMTAGDSLEHRRRTARVAVTVAAFVLVLFTSIGAYLFDVLGISQHAFRITGGLLLFTVAFDMLRARRSTARSTIEEEAEGRDKEDVAIVPLAIPLLSGPGAVATVVMLAGRARGMAQHVTVYAVILAVLLLVYVCLRAASPLSRLFGRTGMNVLGRLMGLLLAAIAVQFVLDGIEGAFFDAPAG